MNKINFSLFTETANIRLLSARGVIAVTLALALSACGGSSDDDTSIIDLINGNLPSGNVPPTEAPPSEDDPPMETSNEEPSGSETPESEMPEPEMPESDSNIVQLREQRTGLTIGYPGDTSLEELSSPFLAFVEVFQIAESPSTTGDIRVELVEYDEDFPFTDHVDFYTNIQDECIIRDLDAAGGDGGGNSNTLVSGGETISLFSAGSTFASVPFTEADGRYFGDNILPAALPQDLSLSVPGDIFPEGTLALNVPSVPQRLSPAIGDEITTSSLYFWVPDNSNQMRIEFLSFVDGEFQGFPMTCFVQDDGEFELPENALAEVESRPGELVVRYVRDTRELFFRNGVATFAAVSLGDNLF